MTEKEVLELARELVDRHIPEMNVEIELSRTKKSLGDARFYPPRIRISKHWIGIVSREETEDTILHEIAHLIAGPHAGHGYEWKRACLRVGARPERNARLNTRPEPSVRGYCPTCDVNVARWYRMPRNQYVHTVCKTVLEYRRVS